MKPQDIKHYMEVLHHFAKRAKANRWWNPIVSRADQGGWIRFIVSQTEEQSAEELKKRFQLIKWKYIFVLDEDSAGLQFFSSATFSQIWEYLIQFIGDEEPIVLLPGQKAIDKFLEFVDYKTGTTKAEDFFDNTKRQRRWSNLFLQQEVMPQIHAKEVLDVANSKYHLFQSRCVYFPVGAGVCLIFLED